MFRKNFRLVFALLLLAMPFMIAAAPWQVTLPPDTQGILTSVLWKGLIFVALILLDVVLGIAEALKDKIFQWQKIADFLATNGLKALGWISLEALALLPLDIQLIGGVQQGAGEAAYALLVIATVASIYGHASRLGVQAPVPPPGS